jgi:predicted Rossmann-fold nucleotide-binding protein
MLSADAVIAIGGKYGTLSEIAIALKAGRPVYGLDTWDIEGVISCSSPEDAVIRAV